LSFEVARLIAQGFTGDNENRLLFAPLDPPMRRSVIGRFLSLRAATQPGECPSGARRGNAPAATPPHVELQPLAALLSWAAKDGKPAMDRPSKGKKCSG
jgi:hypothetical protein